MHGSYLAPRLISLIYQQCQIMIKVEWVSVIYFTKGTCDVAGPNSPRQPTHALGHWPVAKEVDPQRMYYTATVRARPVIPYVSLASRRCKLLTF